MKLILNSSKYFGKFVPEFELSLLYGGYCIKFMVFGKELEVLEMPGRPLHVWTGFRSNRGFLVTTEFFSSSVSQQGSPVSRHSSQA